MRRPERRFVYKGENVDGERWERFAARPDDVFVCTPPKSGTTWMQALCAMVIFLTSEPDFNPAERSPWLDSNAEPVEDVLARLEAQSGRRVLKTHTPLDGIPFFPGCTYIVVYRDPRDTFLSMRNHIANFRLEPRRRTDVPLEEAFRAWVAGRHRPGMELQTLASSTLHHLQTFVEFRMRSEIHFFHYADLKRDLVREIRRVAQLLDTNVDDATLERFAQAASFDKMKRRAERFVPGVSLNAWHEPGRFLNRGTSGQWKGVLSEGALRLFDEALAPLGPELATWLKEGGPLPAT